MRGSGGWSSAAMPSSERDLVVEIGVEAGGRRGGTAPLHRRGAAEIRATLDIAAALAAPVEHGKGRIEALQHHLRRIALDAVLLIFARLQGALEIDLRTLLQILLGDLGEALIEYDDVVPFGPLAPLTGGAV